MNSRRLIRPLPAIRRLDQSVPETVRGGWRADPPGPRRQRREVAKAASERPDLVLMDIQLTMLDRYAATDQCAAGAHHIRVNEPSIRPSPMYLRSH
jgi:CheY-like chemotaxis protein